MSGSSKFYLFPLTSGKKRLAYGRTVEEAIEIMGYRLNADELALMTGEAPQEIRQQDIPDYVNELA